MSVDKTKQKGFTVKFSKNTSTGNNKGNFILIFNRKQKLYVIENDAQMQNQSLSAVLWHNRYGYLNCKS